MTITFQRRAAQQYPSKQPLYRYWEHLRRRCAEKGIPMQSAWRQSYQTFIEAVGEPPAGRKYRLVLINPERGYVWYNVRWLTERRAARPEQWRWLPYRGRRDEAQVWAKRFGIPLRELERRLDRGWTLRQLDHYGRRLAAEAQAQEERIRQAGVTVPNPDVAD